MDKNEVIEILNRKKVVYFATSDTNNNPRVRMFSIIKIVDGKIYFFTADFKEVYLQLRSNPNVEFCLNNKGTMIRIRGKAIFEENPEIVKKFIDEFTGYKKLYENRIEDLKLFYVENGEVHLFKINQVFDKTNFYAFNINE